MNDKTRRKNSGECSKKTPKQQQTPENLPQMFQKKAKTTTNAGKSPANVPKKKAKTATFSGEKTPANVPKNGQNARAGNALATELARKVHWTFRLSKLTL